MSRTQTRRSVSVSGETYLRLKDYAEDNACSMSSIVERLIIATVPDMAKASATFLETGLLNGEASFRDGLAKEPEIVHTKSRVERIRRLAKKRAAERVRAPGLTSEF